MFLTLNILFPLKYGKITFHPALFCAKHIVQCPSKLSLYANNIIFRRLICIKLVDVPSQLYNQHFSKIQKQLTRFLTFVCTINVLLSSSVNIDNHLSFYTNHVVLITTFTVLFSLSTVWEVSNNFSPAIRQLDAGTYSGRRKEFRCTHCPINQKLLSLKNRHTFNLRFPFSEKPWHHANKWEKDRHLAHFFVLLCNAYYNITTLKLKLCKLPKKNQTFRRTTFSTVCQTTHCTFRVHLCEKWHKRLWLKNLKDPEASKGLSTTVGMNSLNCFYPWPKLWLDPTQVLKF